jgi:hypothetical protein
MDLIHVAQDRDKRQDFANTAMNLQAAQTAESLDSLRHRQLFEKQSATLSQSTYVQNSILCYSIQASWGLDGVGSG